jgi:FemAB-related protein (PEP-CTERM system-associated)
MPVEKVNHLNESEYQNYALSSPAANFCHDIAWARIIRDSYRKETAYLLSRRESDGLVDGIAPCVLLDSILFGKQLVSLPYLDFGGLVADTSDAERALISELDSLARRRRATLEIRCRESLQSLSIPQNDKVRMVLPLNPWKEERYWKALDSKVRNQVRKAEKSQVHLVWGREELLEDFYQVLCVNMRTLGSPVHSRKFFINVLKHLPGAQIGTAYREGRCIAGLLRIWWKDSLVVPWASSLKEERVHCPNNALYWDCIREAFRAGTQLFEFGRSTKDEGTYNFKKQWLAQETPLFWYQFNHTGQLNGQISHLSTGRSAALAHLWAKLPLRVTNALGPKLRSLIAA